MKGFTDFFFQTQFLQFIWISRQQNPLKSQYRPHLSSKNCEIESIKSDSLRAFQQHQELPQISIQFSISI
jgi:hypothetical protein